MKTSSFIFRGLQGLAPGLILIAVAFMTNAAGAVSADTDVETQARGLSATGKYEEAVPLWRNALADAAKGKDVHRQLVDSVGLAEALNELGQTHLAEDALEKADVLAKTGTDRRMQARIESSLGTIYMYATDPDDAEGLLTKSLALARQENDDGLTATTLNNLANFQVCQKNNDEAATNYQEGISLA